MMEISELERKVGVLRSVLEKYEFFTGCRLERVNDQTFKIAFAELNPARPDQQCHVHIALYQGNLTGTASS